MSTRTRTGGEALPVVLVGARGHGRWHLRNIRRLAAMGEISLAGVCDVAPLTEPELDGLGAPAYSADLDELLAWTGARIAVICTPLHTHAALALTSARRGAAVLLEKPTTPSAASFGELTEGLSAVGAACQVGFQSLGSHALDAIKDLIDDGAIGAVRGIGAAGAWVRDEAYWRRSAWGGKRSLDGQDVVDGVLTNPLAHAVATALRIDGSDRAQDVASVDLELYRANDIDADDTSCARIRTTRGGEIVIAVTLCAERADDPYVVVHGDAGRIVFWYKADQVVLEREGQPARTTQHTRTDLLANLVSHLRDGTPLLVPPERTGAFMRLVEAVRTAPQPVPLPAHAWRTEPGEGGPRRVVPGIDALIKAGAGRLALYSELSAPWSLPPHRAGSL